MPGNDHYVRQILKSLSPDEDRVCLVYEDTPTRAGELSAAVRSAAAGLRAQGVGAGDVVAVMTVNNTPATLILRYAAGLVGAVVVHVGTVNAVNPGDVLRVREQFDIVRSTRARVFAIDADNAERARELRDRFERPVLLVALGDLGPDVVDLSVLPPDAFDLADAAQGELAVVTYTSGSTGRPKGVCWSYEVRNDVLARMAAQAHRQTVLITAPLTHTAAFTSDNVLVAGGTVVLHHGFDARAVLRAVERHRVTRMMLSAPQVYALKDHPDVNSADLSSLRDLMYTGSPAAADRLAEAVKVFGPVLCQIYGNSECGQMCRLSGDDHTRPELLRTVGRPVDLVTLSIRDLQDDRELPPGEPGEVCVHTPLAMTGYWDDPEQTARTLRDGRLHTGDIGHLDEEGYLHLRGRIADVIKTNGIKVYPAAVEGALAAHPGVAQAAVFGVADADRLERIHAVVVARDGHHVTADDLRDHVATTLSPNQAPAVVTFRAELPVLGFGKPDRLRLRAEAEEAARVPSHNEWEMR
ncbi:fatty-acyl-CoA synthase [Actinacidiphila yanglinensis]|uniref:Fatty-acyl-CoA synthase n=1 Tax=Actinacidiphila yanglinensis TaxID=310779 RepID=A0A1H6C6T1_9ACTN|nr:AMP-binding protein [Actinacidiphila yanglinensis]SEG68618.1 fatty-acyl-CoA synthase [Actinacidiphila yanglinensis]